MLTYDETRNVLCDPNEGPIARLTNVTPAWGSRLARVTAFEAVVKRMLTVRRGADFTDEEIRVREDAARLVASIEQCVCGRTAGRQELCRCGGCPACCERDCQPNFTTGVSKCGHCGNLDDTLFPAEA